jgi:hypothetical protein
MPTLRTLPLISFLILLVTALHGAPTYAGTVKPYAGVGTQSTDYSVTVNGQNVPVNAWVHGGGTAHYAHFEFTGTVTIQITNKLGNFEATAISPKRFSITPTISEDTATFNLSTPRKLVVYTGNTRIFIFADGPETTPSQSNLLPGTLQHAPSHYTLFSGQEAPASLTGSLDFLSNPLRGVRMVGRGHYQASRTAELYNLDNFRMDGLVFRNTNKDNWALIPRYIANSIFSNVKLLTQLPGRDGIDIDKSHHVTIEDSFIFSGDDAICLKTHPGRFPVGVTSSAYGDIGTPQPPAPDHDIMIRNSTLISGWNAMKFGPETSADYYNVTFENIDVLEGYSGISVEGVKALQNIHFHNVRMEKITGQYFMYMEYTYATKPGTIYVDNLVVDQAKGISIISTHQKMDIFFTHLTVAGRRITSLADLQQVAGAANVVVSENVGLYFDNPTPDTQAPSVPGTLR